MTPSSSTASRVGSRIISEALVIAILLLVQYAIVAWHYAGLVDSDAHFEWRLRQLALAPTLIYDRSDATLVLRSTLSVYAAVRGALLLTRLPIAWGLGIAGTVVAAAQSDHVCSIGRSLIADTVFPLKGGEVPAEIETLAALMLGGPVAWLKRDVAVCFVAVSSLLAALAIVRWVCGKLVMLLRAKGVF